MPGNQDSMPLSKTKLMRGYRCPKALYLTIYNPEAETKASEDQKSKFAQGTAIGEIARKKFPNGTLVDNKPWDFGGSLKRTRELLDQSTEVIFEAAFEHRGCYARADIIRYSRISQKWSIIEVKSSTKVKDEHLDDAALQAWIISNAGLPIESVNILHLNGDCRYPDLNDLFLTVDVTEQARDRYTATSAKVEELIAVLNSASIPEVDIGPHCMEPNECGFKSFCWGIKNIPKPSVLDLPNSRDRKWEFYRSGIRELKDVPLAELSELQKRVVNCHANLSQHIDREGIDTALSGWNFPLVFLDFETINPAIPRFNGCRPYDQVPFQFSVHIWKEASAPLEHKEFLHCDSSDPRVSLVRQLIDACGGGGSIVSYYAKFESARVKELAEDMPQYVCRRNKAYFRLFR